MTNKDLEKSLEFNEVCEKYDISSQESSYKKALIRTLENYLPISYDEYKKLDFSEQQKIIEDIRKSNGIIKEDLFQVRARNYFKKLEKSSKKGKRLIRKLERSSRQIKRLIEKATTSSIIRK